MAGAVEAPILQRTGKDNLKGKAEPRGHVGIVVFPVRDRAMELAQL